MHPSTSAVTHAYSNQSANRQIAKKNGKTHKMPSHTTTPVAFSFMRDVLNMPQRDFSAMTSISCHELEHEFLDKVRDMREAYVPSCGDFQFGIAEELDAIISTEPRIRIKYPKHGPFKYAVVLYTVTPAQRYITWRDALRSFDERSGRLRKSNNHRYIEGLTQTAPVQYELECGS
jgi:hypothetical protein